MRTQSECNSCHNKNIRYYPLFLSSVASGILLTAACQLHAGEVDSQGYAESTIEEVIVTSRRRTENLQDVPVSVTAFSAADIKEIDITDITHISQLSPNLIVQPNTGGHDGTVICMRGLCRTDLTITEDPMVGLYLDGVYVGKSIGSLFDMAELERVEVLRGPQGTLYGKNTLGGAILLHTRKPSGEFAGNVTLTVGNYGRADLRGYVEFPVTGQLAGSVTFLSKNRDPFVENTLGDDRWDEDNQAARAAIRWQPSESIIVDYAYDWQKKREEPLGAQLTSATGHVIHPEYGIPIGLGDWFSQDVRPEREDKVHTYGASHNKLDMSGHGLTVQFDLGDRGLFQNLSLTSITGYRDVENDLLGNSTGASSAYVYINDTFDYDALSQEIQLAGSAHDDFLDFVFGVFYFNEEGVYAQNQEINAFAADIYSPTEVDNTTWAVFTEVNMNFTDQLALSLGVRYTDEEREQNHTLTDNPTGFMVLDTYNQTYLGAPQYYPTKIEGNNTSPRIVLNYHWTDDLMTYASYAKGFKSGGFNARANTPLQWGPYDDMEVDSYEIGMKSTWWDGRARFNLTGFYQDLTDMQAQVNAVDPQNSQGGFSVVIQNAAAATVAGFEAELLVNLTEGLTLNAGYGYIDAEYDEFVSTDPITGEPSDVADDRAIEFTPPNSYNLSLIYEFPQFNSNGALFGRLDWSGQSKVRFTPKISGNDDIAQESYDLLNARLTYEINSVAGGTLSFAAWGKNITDEEYKIGGWEIDAGDPEFGGIGRTGISQWGEPRTYGVDVTYTWGNIR